MKVNSRSFSLFYNKRLTIQQVLNWVSLYWFSRAGPAASVRIYYEVNKDGPPIVYEPTTIPVGYSYFPKEIICLPLRYDLIQILFFLFYLLISILFSFLFQVVQGA